LGGCTLETLPHIMRAIPAYVDFHLRFEDFGQVTPSSVALALLSSIRHRPLYVVLIDLEPWLWEPSALMNRLLTADIFLSIKIANHLSLLHVRTSLECPWGFDEAG